MAPKPILSVISGVAAEEVEGEDRLVETLQKVRVKMVVLVPVGGARDHPEFPDGSRLKLLKKMVRRPGGETVFAAWPVSNEKHWNSKSFLP